MIKRILKYLFYGISWGCTFFVIFNCIGVITTGNEFLKQLSDNFVQQALGSMFVGICCASSSIVYTFEKMAFGMQIGIHFIIGLTGYFFTAYHLKWIPMTSGLHIIVFILFGVSVFFGIWFCFYLYNKCEAKKLNQRLKELDVQTDTPTK